MKHSIKKHISDLGMKTFFRYQWDRILDDDEIAYIADNPLALLTYKKTILTSTNPTDDQLEKLDKEAW